MLWIAEILNTISVLLGLTKDLIWGEWLKGRTEILGSVPMYKLFINYFPIVIITVFILTYLFKTYKSILQNNLVTTRIFQRILKQFHSDVFNSASSANDDFNRISFFTRKSKWIVFRRVGRKFKFYIPFFKDYLIVSARSGKFQKTLTSFEIDRDGDKEVEDSGIAGMAWHKPSETIIKKNLNPENVKSYCEKTNLSQKDFNKLNSRSKFYTAFCILDTHQNKIGVVVVDSINQHELELTIRKWLAKSLGTIHEGKKNE